jgi:hypothetical protein
VDLVQLFHLAAAGHCNTVHGALPSLYQGLCVGAGNEVQIKSISDFALIISNILRILIASAGALAIITILVSAIYYITSTGDPARVKKAKDILINTVTGLVLIIMSYAVVTFIAGNF